MIHVSESHRAAPTAGEDPARYFLDESTDVTVILTVWKREYLDEQITSLISQSKRPSQVWIYQCGNFVDIDRILQKYPEIETIKSSVNLKYFGRFSLACYAKTKYVWILDDDVMPSAAWIERCLAKCAAENAIISCAGRRIPARFDLPACETDVNAYFFGDVAPDIAHAFCKEDTAVDYGCGGWFLKAEWLKDFWSIPPFTLENAEDIHLSATCLLKSGVTTIVPIQLDELQSGNTRVEYGRDGFSSWKTPGFEQIRNDVIEYLFTNLNWKPMLWPN